MTAPARGSTNAVVPAALSCIWGCLRIENRACCVSGKPVVAFRHSREDDGVREGADLGRPFAGAGEGPQPEGYCQHEGTTRPSEEVAEREKHAPAKQQVLIKHGVRPGT